MIIKTKTKVMLAGWLYGVVSVARAAGGKDDHVVVWRDSLRWSLDLREGIDFSIYVLGAFERSTAETLAKLVRQGDVVFDIGANMGSHTLGLARSVGKTGRVYAFEPADLAFVKLKRNLSLNPELDKRTRPCQILLGAEPTAQPPTELYASWPLRSKDPVHPKHRGRLVSASRASVDTLDRFIDREGLERLDLIKMDVDGEEYSVLKGASKALAEFRPVLLMEIQPYSQEEHGHGFAALVSLLQDTGYAIQDAASGRPLPLSVDGLLRIIPDGASLNVIARPASAGNLKHRGKNAVDAFSS